MTDKERIAQLEAQVKTLTQFMEDVKRALWDGRTFEQHEAHEEWLADRQAEAEAFKWRQEHGR